MASSPPVDEMDMDSMEDDAMPRPRKHEEMVLAHLTQSEVESEDMEDDKPFKTPSVLVRKGRYQPKIVEDTDEDNDEDTDTDEDTEQRSADKVSYLCWLLSGVDNDHNHLMITL